MSSGRSNETDGRGQSIDPFKTIQAPPGRSRTAAPRVAVCLQSCLAVLRSANKHQIYTEDA